MNGTLPKAGERGTCVSLGNFDGIHIGHRRIIDSCVARAKETGRLSLVWSFRRHPEHIMKGNFSSGNIMSLPDKDEILRQMGVSLLVLEDFERVRGFSPQEFCDRILLGELCATAVFCGFNFRFGKNGEGSAAFLKEYLEPKGVEVHVTEPVCVDGEPVSSTRIRAALQNGDIALAEKLLGRPYAIRFPVLHGKKLATRLGFPTMNQVFPEEYVTLKNGVWAVRVFFDGQAFDGVCNVGCRPTVEKDGRIVAETHLFDFCGDLYGRLVTVRFDAFLRPEQKFSSVEELQIQIEKDRNRAMLFRRGEE